MNYLSASLLAADFAKLGEQIQEVDKAGAHYIHYDVMDGCFVPNISMGIPVLSSIRKCTDKILDVHLMIEDPARYIGDFAKAGADIITVHAEAATHLDQVIRSIKALGLKAGVALNPATPVNVVENILQMADMILIMTVNPGFGGQKLIDYTLDKITVLREMISDKGLNTDIEVDGGVTVDNVDKVLKAGANVIVSGSSVFKGNATENTKRFLEKLGRNC
ncbi:MAG: ribulose-phosphate 3-epimerase [Lachnospiraceae bacterium]|nr:ribulose-phosphate 3-epimerase [Lachnospiraceae bacterium]